jgi:ABC-type transporter Mla subunit MlaD
VNAVQLAALIAAGFFAIGVCAAVYVLVKLGRLISAAGGMLSDYRVRADALIDRAEAAVDRSNEQLTRTDAITANMDQVSANMAELSGQVSALAGLARGISAGLGTPLTKIAALSFGIRRAVALRHGLEAGAATGRQAAMPGQRPALTSRPERAPR